MGPKIQCGDCGKQIDTMKPTLDAGHARDCESVQIAKERCARGFGPDGLTDKEAKVLHAEQRE